MELESGELAAWLMSRVPKPKSKMAAAPAVRSVSVFSRVVGALQSATDPMTGAARKKLVAQRATLERELGIHRVKVGELEVEVEKWEDKARLYVSQHTVAGNKRAKRYLARVVSSRATIKSQEAAAAPMRTMLEQVTRQLSVIDTAHVVRQTTRAATRMRNSAGLTAEGIDDLGVDVDEMKDTTDDLEDIFSVLGGATTDVREAESAAADALLAEMMAESISLALPPPGEGVPPSVRASSVRSRAALGDAGGDSDDEPGAAAPRLPRSRRSKVVDDGV